MKYRRRIAAFIMLAALLVSSTVCEAAVPNKIDWGATVNLPSSKSIKAHKGRKRAPYICCEPVFKDKSTYVEYSVDFRADHLPKGTYLCVNNFDFDPTSLLERYRSIRRDYSGVAGYAGFQRDLSGRCCILLTIWDTYCYDSKGNMTRIHARQVYPKNNKGFEACTGDTVTGEGCFVHTSLTYNWKKGRNYRALLQLSNPPDGSNSHILFWVCDLKTKRWSLLVEYDLGYHGAYMNRSVAFLEDFSYDKSGSLRSMVLSNFRVNSTRSGWIGTKKAEFSCMYSNGGSYRYGTKGNAFWAITTGLRKRWKAPKTKIYTVKSCETRMPY